MLTSQTSILDYQILEFLIKAVFNHVEPGILTTGTKMSKFQEFILVLMKLRLNSQMQT